MRLRFLVFCSCLGVVFSACDARSNLDVAKHKASQGRGHKLSQKTPPVALRVGSDTIEFATVVRHSESFQIPATRIVSLAPSLTELLFEIGAGEKMVGVTKFCDYPKEAQQLPKVGGYVDLDSEALLALKPDLVVGLKGQKNQEVASLLDKFKIPYVFLSTDSHKEYLDNSQDLAQLLLPTASSNISYDMSNNMLDIKDNINSLRQKASNHLKAIEGKLTGITYLFVVSRDPLMVAAKGSFPDEILGLSGAKNLAPAHGTSYPILDLETFVALDPDLILETAAGKAPGPWHGFPDLRAVKRDRVFHLTDDGLVRPGPRMLPSYLRLVTMLKKEFAGQGS